MDRGGGADGHGLQMGCENRRCKHRFRFAALTHATARLWRRPTLDFLRTEAGSGVLLAAVALAAVIIANSPVRTLFRLRGHGDPVRIGGFAHTLSVAH